MDYDQPALPILEEMGACEESREWVDGLSVREAWRECIERGWMDWWLDELRVEPDCFVSAEEAYEAVMRPARDAYAVSSMPACEVFRSAIGAAEAVRAAEPATCARALDVYCAAIRVAEYAYRAAIAPAVAEYQKVREQAGKAYCDAVREVFPLPPMPD